LKGKTARKSQRRKNWAREIKSPQKKKRPRQKNHWEHQKGTSLVDGGGERNQVRENNKGRQEKGGQERKKKV